MSKRSTIAAIYARVSTQHHGQNPEVQLVELRRFCEARGWTIGHEVVDHGHSGGSTSRPGLKSLMTLVRGREVDVVIVARLDRLFRSTRHLLTTVAEFTDLGAEFVSLKEAIDLSTASGKLLLSILGALGEFEKDLMRERTMAGLAFARARGKRLGRPRQHDTSKIRHLRSQGLSYRDIQRRLGLSAGTVFRALAGAPKSPSAPAQNISIKSGSHDD